MLETFGTKLRRQRELRRVSLHAIAEQTKIKVSLLEALERDDVSHWPVGIFRRGYFRSYAQAVGLDPEPLVREFLELYPDPTDVAPPEPPPPTGIRYLVGSAMRSLSGSRDTAADAPTLRTGPEPRRRSVVAADPDLVALAGLCTAVSAADDATDMAPLLREAARIVDATGLIVWEWAPLMERLRPTLAHGYPQSLLTQLPGVPRNADNATAAAFRSEQICVVNGDGQSNGALALPLMAPGGCIGVLALEVVSGGERNPIVRAVATILAAQFARVIDAAPFAKVTRPSPSACSRSLG